MNPVPAHLEALLQRELIGDEKVLWRAQPLPMLRMKSALGTFGFGMLFFAFAVFGTFTANSQPKARHVHSGAWAEFFPILWGGTIICIGGAMLLSPLKEWWIARHTIYAITDRRAIAIEAPWKRVIRTFEADQLASFERREDSSGAGDIVFVREVSRGAKGRTVVLHIGFLGLPDTKEAESLLRAVHERNKKA